MINSCGVAEKLTAPGDTRTGSRRVPWWLAAALTLLAPLAQAESAPAEVPEEGRPAAMSDQDDNYVIGPGDTIQVFVWRNPELSVSVPVRPDGKVSTPLVEDIVAVGKTPSQLARDMEARLAEYIRSPQVNIIVSNPVSRLSQVQVIGQVGKPGAVPYREGMTVLDVILEAGGLTEFAAGNRTKLLRKEESGETREIRIKLESLLKKGKIDENVDVQPGDLLLVPESLF